VARPEPFDFPDYRTYLQAALAALRREQKGVQGRLATHMGCQPAYLSMVLKDRAELSLEQAASANEFFEHSEGASHYFLLLVQKARAGTAKLKHYFEAQLLEILAGRSHLASRLTYSQTLTDDQRGIFYSAWYYMAVHMALTIPALQERQALRDYLRLPPETINRVLEFLVVTGLARQESGRYIVGATRIHLGGESPFTNQSHCNWRLQAVQALQRPRSEDFHYSSVVSASRNDMPVLREIMIKAIEQIRAVIRPSPEEDLLCYNMDLFGLRQ